MLSSVFDVLVLRFSVSVEKWNLLARESSSVQDRIQTSGCGFVLL